MGKVVHHGGASTLADVLDRVLDKGVVVAGDVAISLVGVELLTIRLRLLVASVDKAREIGISWWETDPFLSSKAKDLEAENDDLRNRLEKLEQRLGLQTTEQSGLQIKRHDLSAVTGRDRVSQKARASSDEDAAT